MKRKLLLLNLALLILVCAAGWQLRARWLDGRTQERKALKTAARVAPQAPEPVPHAPQPPAAAAYGDVAQKTLFAKDRNPNVIEEVVAPKPVPPFPVAYGRMNLGGAPRVILAEKPGDPARSHTAGAKVGEFTLEAIEGDEVVLSWEGQQFRKKLQELRPQSGAAPAVAPVAAEAPAEAAAPAQVQTVAAAAAVEGPDPNETGDMRSCQANDTSPAGTVRDGFRKVMTQGPFGFSCHWERIK